MIFCAIVFLCLVFLFHYFCIPMFHFEFTRLTSVSKCELLERIALLDMTSFFFFFFFGGGGGGGGGSVFFSFP